MVAMLIGCGLRRAELLALTFESIQQREEHWVIADLVGKGGHVRTVPIPGRVKDAVDAWTDAVDITHGPVFRAINKAGRVWGDGMSPKVLWDVVRAAAGRAGIESSHRTTSAARVRGSVTWRAANCVRDPEARGRAWVASSCEISTSASATASFTIADSFTEPSSLRRESRAIRRVASAKR
jgi:integrase